MDFLAKLNPEQRRAVVTTEGPVLILAGAGSGKTRVITHRVAYLMGERGVSPKNILAVTFTNKAAQEMKTRIKEMVTARGAKDLTVSTFHALGVRILRKYIDRLGYKHNFSIYNTAEQQSVVKHVLQQLQLCGQFSFEELHYRIDHYKNNNVYPDDLSPMADDSLFHVMVEVYPRYQEYLKSYNALDFSDLLGLTAKLFALHPDVRDACAGRYRYVMVDEYQDTNHAQYRLAESLAREHENICVVGDDDQSIYSWRGADVGNILRFESDFENCTTIRLEQNYRSTETILTAANAVIANNKARKEKTMWSANGKGEPLSIVACEDEQDEAAFITGAIAETALSQRRLYGDFAVLFRANHLTREIEEQMMIRGMPYVVIGGKKFYDRKEVKDALAYIKFFANARDDVSLLRILNYPKRGLAETTVGKVMDYSISRGLSFYDALLDHERIDTILSKVVHGSIREFLNLMEGRRETVFKGDFAKNMSVFFEKIKLREEMMNDEKDPKRGERKYDNIRELISGISTYFNEAQSPSIYGYLERLSLLLESEDSQKPVRNAVTLITLHSAKGLEFPCVFLAAFEKDLLPHLRSLEEGSLEEERRLLYVGMTRAMETLTLTYASRRKRMGVEVKTGASPFIKEIPEALVEQEGSGFEERAAAARDKALAEMAKMLE